MEPQVPLVIIGVIAGLILIWVVATYNILVRLRQQCAEAWSGIDTELRRRYDLIPNLVATVKGYAAHERELFQAVVEARTKAQSSSGSPEAQARDENVLIDGIKQLFAVSEAYPELKASENFLKLQSELANTEDRIQAARRFFNGNVRDYRNKCQTFPSNLIANSFGFQSEGYFNVSPSVREVPDADFG